MTLPLYHHTASLITPELGYALTHHLQNPYSPFAPSICIYLDTFPSLTAAQAAAQVAIEDTTRELSKFKFSDFVCKDIDFWTRALVTAGTTDGVERLLSQFVISAVNVWTEGWAPEMGGEEVDALFTQKESNEIVVRIPPAPAVVVHLHPVRNTRKLEGDETKQSVGYELVCEEERASNWVLNQIPQFRRRDEGPFRDECDQPYRQEMGHVTMRRWSLGWPRIIQTVVDQDGDLSKQRKKEDEKFNSYGEWEISHNVGGTMKLT